MNNLEFALEMKNKRLASGLSQGELASLTHVSRYSINRFENGKANASKETQNNQTGTSECKGCIYRTLCSEEAGSFQTYSEK